MSTPLPYIRDDLLYCSTCDDAKVKYYEKHIVEFVSTVYISNGQVRHENEEALDDYMEEAYLECPECNAQWDEETLNLSVLEVREDGPEKEE